ncbi:proline--tRNA ligase [Candidatus Southlakia epibionticum]|uniref:Proline--tRNA ligase n=1 Tax=Candidatus Southlakia epibionticum TaxID=3043284 RepID=A0ABY8WTZ1_9BACT|nr:proline--tRNA ligase [Candidatus Saccharimonadaceae bacterium ML1]
MRLSKNFTRTTKQAPADEVARNAQLLIRAGFVFKTMAGVYSYTPLGLRVLENIKQIVREEMNAIGSQELIMSTLQRKELWQETGRWSDELVDVWFKSTLQDGTDVGFGWTHEEPIVELLRSYLKSYKDLPISVYQFQNKLRNELRAKSGIMRGREFIMKDMYSVHAAKEDLDAYYDQVIEAYKRCYDRFGIGDDTYVTFASGGAFTKFSHEFQTICEAGEDYIYLHRGKNIAVNEEVLDDAVKELGIKRNELEKVKTAEVGNIFNFGTQKSEEMNLVFTGSDGVQHYAYMGSYGIGITRVMGVIVEKFADEKGLIWPENIAPARVYLVQIGEKSRAAADELYETLGAQGVEVLYDERDERPGVKFADAELMGIPLRVTVSDRLLDGKKWEVAMRASGERQLLTTDELLATLK